MEPKPRLLIFDTLSEYDQGVVFGTEDREQLRDFWKKVYGKNFRIIYRPILPEQEIDAFCELVFGLGNLTFAIEEIDCYCSAFKISDQFAAVIQRGRHKQIELIGITQRPYGMHRLLTSQAKTMYIFNTNEPRDRDYLRIYCGAEIDAKLDSLKQYEYVKWEDGSPELTIGTA